MRCHTLAYARPTFGLAGAHFIPESIVPGAGTFRLYDLANLADVVARGMYEALLSRRATSTNKNESVTQALLSGSWGKILVKFKIVRKR